MDDLHHKIQLFLFNMSNSFIKNIKYIVEHKKNVFIEGRKLKVGIWQLLLHDLSKFSRFELKQYQRKFFEENTDKIKSDFDLAWLHHQHWLQVSNNKIIAYEMPLKYIKEMLADWNAMSRKFQDKNNVRKSTEEWFYKRKNIILHQNTLKIIIYYFENGII